MIITVDTINGTEMTYKKVTPKAKAREILLDKLLESDYWTECDHYTKDMTEREQEQVQRMLDIEVARIRNKWDI